MAIIKNAIDFGSGFNIKSQGPIDSRMIVEYISDLTTVWDSDSPVYVGMIVSVLEDGNVYVLRNKDYTDINNWKKQGSGSGTGIGKYSLPIMTEEMKNAALEDSNSGFKEDSSYISIDDGSSLNGETESNTITSVNGTYLHVIMNNIRALQAEVAKLKNSFQYGIHSYNNEVTAKSSVLDQYEESLIDEPLWALDPYMMSEVIDDDFNTELIAKNFTITGNGEESIHEGIPEQLTFVNGTGKFSDSSETLLNLTDSKLVTYLVTDSKHVRFNLHTKDRHKADFVAIYWNDPVNGENYDSKIGENKIYDWGIEYDSELEKDNVVIYKSDESLYFEDETADYYDKYFYRGTVNVDGVEYDSWKKWEENYGDWYYDEERGQQYALTERIVLDGSVVWQYNDDFNRVVDISSFIEDDYNKYGIMFVLSRKVGEHGKNYVYVSVMNYETNEKIIEGYLTDNNTLEFATGGETTVYEVDYKYSIESIEFVEQTLYRMKFYSKYEDFSEEVIPSSPEEDYSYKVSHLSIRSVKNEEMIENIKEQLHENELSWNEDKKELNIKSNNEIYKIGGSKIISLNQEEYNNINEYDPDTIYLINYDDSTSSEDNTSSENINIQSGSLIITNIYNSPYKSLTNSYNVGNEVKEYNTYERLYSDIIFNLNCDSKTLCDIKDNIYVTLSRYAKSRKKYSVFNDVKQSDERLKMYCWVVKNSYNSVDFSYFYTPYDYNNDVNEMWDNCFDGNNIYTSRLPFPEDRCYGSLGENNNYVTSINQLVYDDRFRLDDYWDSSKIERYSEGDVDSYYINALSANPIRKWINEWWDDEMDSLIENEKNNFMEWVSYKSFSKRGFVEREGERYDLYGYKTYCGDYPIIPFKLADCEVQIWGDLAEKYFDDSIDKWIKLSDMEEEDIKSLKQIIFRFPYNTNEIIARMYINSQCKDFIYRDWSKFIYYDDICSSNRVGGSYDVDVENNSPLTIPLILGLCKEEQIKSGNYKDIPQYKFSLWGSIGCCTYDSWTDEIRPIFITRLRY